MPHEKRIMTDIGMKNLPFPITVLSRESSDGQRTIASISAHARIIQEFEANWIDRFVNVLHEHGDNIGTLTLRTNIHDYLKALNASSVTVKFEYPFFVNKTTPVSKKHCLVQYSCMYSAKLRASDTIPKIEFQIKIPVVTTDPASDPEKHGGLFGQLSVVTLEAQFKNDCYVEDLIDIVDQHALSPVYSFLTDEDKAYIVNKVHSTRTTSVVLTDAIAQELARNEDIEWYSVRCDNHSMLRLYSTQVGSEKNMCVPDSDYDADDL